MSFSEVANCLLISIALASGIPQETAEAPQEVPGPLPFLQFTNGGIRLNFGGYHAEAGLGGLLRGTGTGGGLHASVGTPWGGHAGAGLGGRLNGDDGNLGGGLYARAGLGRGRPEAAAGLGGRLDGSGRSSNPILGGLYAGATPGDSPGVGVYLGTDADKEIIEGATSGNAPNEVMIPQVSNAENSPSIASPDAATSRTKPAKGRTNIQIIPSRGKNTQKEKEKVTLSTDAPAGGKTESRDKEIRRAAPPVDLVKSIYVEHAPVVKSIEKTVVASAPPVPIAPIISSNVINSTATPVENQPNVITKPRWHFRKRFWGAPRKTIYVTPAATIDSQDAPSDIVGGIYTNAVADTGAVAGGKTYSGSLFDDIFNIPISTLSAVNQLLRNNVG